MTPVPLPSIKSRFPGASWFWNSGANDLTAVYSFDGSTTGPSVSNTVNLTVTPRRLRISRLAAQTTAGFTPAGRYSVVVTATAGTVVHNVRIGVVMQ